MDAIRKACEAIQEADGLLITAGAGLGVDSGLPDFRGRDGFWKAYPALAQGGIQFQEIASPSAFHRNPYQAWGFYAHRLKLYRQTEPHQGFQILKAIAEQFSKHYFVVTSNVDGQFQKAGFQPECIDEVHGSIHYLQCLNACRPIVWPADDFDPTVDEGRCLLVSELPTCPHCGGLARPNILMFADSSWQDHRSRMQARKLHAWQQNTTQKVIVELGAGLEVPTIRIISERQDGVLIRINPRDCAVPKNGISIPMGALEALQRISAQLGGGARTASIFAKRCPRMGSRHRCR